MGMLIADNCILMAIDYQEKLVNMLKDNLIAIKMGKLITASKILHIPTIVTEQYPKGLGATVADFDLTDVTVIEKTSFSAFQEERVRKFLKLSGKKQVIIGGIETHICVHQTVSALIDAGFDVYVVKDACGSRSDFEFNQGLELMRQNGAKITTLEIVLFELLRTSKHPNFKEIQALIK